MSKLNRETAQTLMSYTSHTNAPPSAHTCGCVGEGDFLYNQLKQKEKAQV